MLGARVKGPRRACRRALSLLVAGLVVVAGACGTSAKSASPATTAAPKAATTTVAPKAATTTTVAPKAKAAKSGPGVCSTSVTMPDGTLAKLTITKGPVTCPAALALWHNYLTNPGPTQGSINSATIDGYSCAATLLTISQQTGELGGCDGPGGTFRLDKAVSGGAPCTAAAVLTALGSAAAANTVEEVHCDGQWAIAGVLNSAGGSTVVLNSTSGTWKVIDQGTALCLTQDGMPPAVIAALSPGGPGHCSAG
jgi:hypothetical protein